MGRGKRKAMMFFGIEEVDGAAGEGLVRGMFEQMITFILAEGAAGTPWGG